MTKDYRRCVSCRKVAHRSEFWRLVRSHPSSQIIIDRGNTFVQGRSAYLCPTASCLQIAQKKNRLGKSLKAQVRDDIYQQLELLKFTR
ncbi:YlxR family protein [Chamaesiphon sp. VAR_48_metabat_135_sub]|uniref:YlxR family protein n=1 Tax=Chamaesiphon sp. VAR_48_metabat_135_sub TaxID=2964699 RepID=UPI00286AA254|nr:YlxR family protein [Chamaesiphon sp. VAR_48_metabat_135_sub]